jgi:hypothetical protein
MHIFRCKFNQVIHITLNLVKNLCLHVRVSGRMFTKSEKVMSGNVKATGSAHGHWDPMCEESRLQRIVLARTERSPVGSGPCSSSETTVCRECFMRHGSVRSLRVVWDKGIWRGSVLWETWISYETMNLKMKCSMRNLNILWDQESEDEVFYEKLECLIRPWIWRWSVLW